MLGPSKLRCREPQRSKHYSSAQSKDTMLSLQHDIQDQLIDHYQEHWCFAEPGNATCWSRMRR
jgi:hypothetical protein